MELAVGNVHRAFRSFWHPIAWSSEVTSTELFSTMLLNEALVAVRRFDGGVDVFRDECPHRGAPLSRGRVDAGRIVCGFHGWEFESGVAVAIPALGTGASLPPRACLSRPAHVCERYGIVWVAPEQPRLPVIDWPEFDDPTLSGYSPTAHIAEVLAAYQADNLLDASHFSFLHTSLRHRNPVLGEYETVQFDELRFRTRARKLEFDGETTEGWLQYVYEAPFTVALRSDEPDGALRTSFLQVIQPLDDHRTRLFFLVRVPASTDDDIAAMREVEEGVQREDLAMNSALRRSAMPLGSGDLHVRTDRNGVLMRRVLGDLVRRAEQVPP